MKLAIAHPCSFQMIPASFMDSMLALQKPAGEYVYIRANMYHSIDDLRNSIVNEALRLDCTHVLMIDSDMIVNPNTIPVLVERDVDIVGALYFNKFPPYEPTAVINDDIFPAWQADSFYEVDKIGTGCILIKTDVFRHMQEPYFEIIRDKGKPLISEDFSFCDKARLLLGYKIWCDSTIIAGHITESIVTENTRKSWERGNESTS